MINRRFILYLKGERGLTVFRAIHSLGYLPLYVFLESEDCRSIDLLKELQLDYQIVGNPKCHEHIEFVRNLMPALIVCAGYSKLIPSSIIDIPEIGIINCHGGSLPKYRGASPIPWQLINGETSGTAYVLKLTAGVDDGEILASENYSIDSTDTAREVTDKVLAIFSRLVPGVLSQIAESGTLPAGTLQSANDVTRWAKRYPEDGEIDWDSNVQAIINLVRALNKPYPGAFFKVQGLQVTVWRAKVLPENYRGVPGRVLGRRSGSLVVACRDGAISLEEVELDGSILNGDKLPFQYGFLLSKN